MAPDAPVDFGKCLRAIHETREPFAAAGKKALK
jgi:hypothetical protein